MRDVRTVALSLVSFGACLAVGCSDEGGQGDAGGGDATGDVLDSETAAETEIILPDTFESTDPDSVEPADTLTDATPTDTADTADTEEPVPDSDVRPDNSLCSPAGGSLNVYDLQNPDCPDHPRPEPTTTATAMPVELTGLVITGTFGDTFTAQDPRGGPYSGIAIFNHGLHADEAKVGDLVDIQGKYSEFFENTQVYLDAMDFKGTAPVPAPFIAEHPAHLATNGQLAEMFEGVLVQVRDVYTTHTQPDCPNDYGEFEVTGRLRIDDLGFRWNAPTGARLGDHFESITGPLLFTFGNHKIEPRDEADVVVLAKGDGNGISKCLATDCRARADAFVSHQVVVNEIMADPFGDDTYQEWIELYNPGDQPVNLAGWAIRDCGDQLVVLSGADARIAAKGYLVVGMTKDRDDNGGVPVGYEYGLDGFYLPNTVGAVLLYDGEGAAATLVDQTRFSRFAPFDSFFSGASIERKSPSNDGTKPESWQAGSSEFGDLGNEGTPGKRND